MENVVSFSDLVLFLLPESAYPLAVVAICAGAMVGFLPVSKAARLVLLLAFLPVMTTVLQQVMDILPWYSAPAVFLFVVLSVVRGILELFLGREAAGHVLGWTVIACVRTAFRLVAGILGLAAGAVQRAARAPNRAEPRRLN